MNRINKVIKIPEIELQLEKKPMKNVDKFSFEVNFGEISGALYLKKASTKKLQKLILVYEDEDIDQQEI